MDNDQKHKKEHAKNPDWQVPMKLKSVKPEDYRASIDSANGSAGLVNPKQSRDT